MTKADLARVLHRRVGGLSRHQSADLIDLLFKIVKETLGHGENVKVSGFGIFALRDKGPRRGRNPQSGQPITISARRVLSFKASPIVRRRVNDERAAVDQEALSETGASPKASAHEGGNAG